jgi:DNA polymerase III sliding clamp (beta) subunit (PCNA family)
MSTIQFSVKADTFIKALKFASFSAGKKDVRYYLNAIYLEVIDGVLHVTGTDGHRLSNVQIQLDTHSVNGEILLCNTFIKTLLALKPIGNMMLELTSDSVVTMGKSFSVVTMDGQFPNYRRILTDPDTSNHGAIIINAKYLEDASKGAAIFGNKKYNTLTIEVDNVIHKTYYRTVIDTSVYPEVMGAFTLVMACKP